MSEFARPRGLGRGLSALLGEPVRTDAPKPANASPAVAPAAPSPTASAPQVQRPIEPPRNVFELPVTSVAPQPAPQPAPAPTPAAPTQAANTNDGPRSIAIDLVQRNPQQPRKHFDENDLSELAGSIKTHGVLQPILVRPIPGGRYEIVAGERCCFFGHGSGPYFLVACFLPAIGFAGPLRVRALVCVR